MVILQIERTIDNRKFLESTAKSYISNSYQGNLNFHRHRIPYTLQDRAIHFMPAVLSETTCHFLTVLCLPQVPLQEVIVKRNRKVPQKQQMVWLYLSILFSSVSSSDFAYLWLVFLFFSRPSDIRA